MKISINHHDCEVADGATLEDVLRLRGFAGPGIAVAVDARVVRRADFSTTVLSEGASLTVFKAVCGG